MASSDLDAKDGANAGPQRHKIFSKIGIGPEVLRLGAGVTKSAGKCKNVEEGGYHARSVVGG
jgi:hypothetical protein